MLASTGIVIEERKVRHTWTAHWEKIPFDVKKDRQKYGDAGVFRCEIFVFRSQQGTWKVSWFAPRHVTRWWQLTMALRWENIWRSERQYLRLTLKELDFSGVRGMEAFDEVALARLAVFFQDYWPGLASSELVQGVLEYLCRFTVWSAPRIPGRRAVAAAAVG